MSKYQNTPETRRESRTFGGRFRGGVLAPVMAQAYRESEGGLLNQTVTFELDPVAGRMITPITAEVVAVYVPVQAMDALKNPLEDYSGNTEVVRDKLLSGTPLFTLEEENEISKRCAVTPRSIAGVKKVNESVRLAHNCAINFLRQRKYVKAVKLLADNMGVTPAIISQTILDRFNGVLDPEDRVEGAVDLTIASVKIPVSGIGRASTTTMAGPYTGNEETDGTVKTYAGGTTGSGMKIEEDPDNPGRPNIYADFDGQSAGNVSLTDFFNAQKMDEIMREMRKIVDDNPEYGEDMAIRWAHGLSVDTGKTPFVVYENAVAFGSQYEKATDGTGITGDVAQTLFAQEISFTTAIPKTELGGIVVTFASVKPDETLSSQPHPIMSEEWGAINYVSEELARDPVAVTYRDIDADVDSVDEGTIACYVGHNHLKKAYISYGFNRHLDTNDVANKTALWQIEVPMSVTKDSVIYPEDISQYPFKDALAEICTYTVNNTALITTPLIFGPTPVEELAVVETEDLFEEEI